MSYSRPIVRDARVRLFMAAVRLTGKRTPERTTDVTRGGAMSSASLEAALDLLNLQDQEHRRDIDALRDREIALKFDASGPFSARDAFNGAAASYVQPASIWTENALNGR
jgi:hypothetical protein